MKPSNNRPCKPPIEVTQREEKTTRFIVLVDMEQNIYCPSLEYSTFSKSKYWRQIQDNRGYYVAYAMCLVEKIKTKVYFITGSY